ncbi:MAG: hypothetical protein MZU79_07515 [Anaerotruncus sp.]|nr:hypothetical protein [Anaerotruncus sp.]
MHERTLGRRGRGRARRLGPAGRQALSIPPDGRLEDPSGRRRAGVLDKATARSGRLGPIIAPPWEVPP